MGRPALELGSIYQCRSKWRVAIHRHFCLPQSSSASRFTAGASAFFILSQSGARPERYIECLRFDTMPSLRSFFGQAE